MEAGEHIHWFLTSRCNTQCSYCFKPDNSTTEATERLEMLAKVLVENKVKQVTLGGGEPTLVDGLERVLEILKEGGVYISLHTNGLRLTERKLFRYMGLVDDIGLPLDSLDGTVQARLRAANFMPVFERIFELAESIQEKGISVGYHTVFTGENFKDVPKMYRPIKKHGFAYWRIYEFNENLAFRRLIDKQAPVKKFNKWESLKHLGTPEKGYTDCLLAHFLLTEERMMKHGDECIQLVGVQDEKPIYAFLDNTGDISFYQWFSDTERRKVGNVLDNNFSSIMRKLKEVEEKGPVFDAQSQEEWLEAKADRPIWARIYDGNYFTEEVEEIGKRVMSRFEKLVDLYEKREERMGRR